MNAAIVTGAAGAIGRAICTRLARARYPLLCVDRDPRVAQTAGELTALGIEATSCVVDLTDDGAPEAIWQAADRLGGSEVLVNNAGIMRDGRVHKLSEEDFRVVARVNLVAPIRLAQYLAPRLETGGCIVNISSRAGLGNFGQANYVAAKSGLMGATRALALEHAPRIRVNTVAPGLIETPMTQAMPEEVLEKLVARIPAGRVGRPEDVADVVAALVSSDSAYVTGQVVLACGGRGISG